MKLMVMLVINLFKGICQTYKLANKRRWLSSSFQVLYAPLEELQVNIRPFDGRMSYIVMLEHQPSDFLKLALVLHEIYAWIETADKTMPKLQHVQKGKLFNFKSRASSTCGKALQGSDLQYLLKKLVRGP